MPVKNSTRILMSLVCDETAFKVLLLIWVEELGRDLRNFLIGGFGHERPSDFLCRGLLATSQ